MAPHLPVWVVHLIENNVQHDTNNNATHTSPNAITDRENLKADVTIFPENFDPFLQLGG